MTDEPITRPVGEEREGLTAEWATDWHHEALERGARLRVALAALERIVAEHAEAVEMDSSFTGRQIVMSNIAAQALSEMGDGK